MLIADGRIHETIPTSILDDLVADRTRDILVLLAMLSFNFYPSGSKQQPKWVEIV